MPAYAQATKKNQTVRLAVAGLGLVGRRHVDAIEHVPGVEIVAAVDPSPEGQAFATEKGIPVFSRQLDMIVAHQPDGVILATPTRLHVEQALECVAAKIPALVEKPLADNVADAIKLVTMAEQAGVQLLVGHHRRHNPLIRKAKSMVDEGKIGQVRAVHGTCWFYKPDAYFDEAPWRKLDGAGPISVNLVHDIDLIRHLCGEVVSVQAQACRSLRGFENEDVAAAVLRFENNAIGTISVSDSIVSPWSWEMTSREYPIYPATSQSSYIIGGSHGSLSVPDLTLWTHEEVRDWWTPISATSAPRGSSDPLVNQIKHFQAVIRGEEDPLVSGREGLRTLEVVEAIQRASRTGETVHLTPSSGTTGAVDFSAALSQRSSPAH